MEHMQNKQFIKQSVRFKTIFIVRGFLESNPPPNLTKSDSLFSRKLCQTVTKFLVQKSHVEISTSSTGANCDSLSLINLGDVLKAIVGS
jgi:hypothetical protein